MATSKGKAAEVQPGLRPPDGVSVAKVAAKLVTTDRDLIKQRVEHTDQEVLKKMCEQAIVNVKDRGKHFVGRKTEISTIVDRTVGTINATNDDGRLPGVIVTGAPGVGKTSLIQEARRKLEEDKDIECLMILTAAFKTPRDFSDAIKSKTSHRVRKLLSAAPKESLRTAAHGLDAAVSVLINLKVAVTTLGLAPTDVQVHAAARAFESWEANQIVSVEDCLQTLGFLFPKGVAVIVDEAQTLEDNLDHEDPRQSTAAKIVQALSTSAPRAENGLEKANVVFAGLGDTADVIGSLGSFGLKMIQLQPMKSERIEELIGKEIDDITPPIAGGTKQAIFEAWVPTLIREYGEWTRHAAGAAQGVKKVMAAEGSDALWKPEGWASVITLADSVRKDVYDYVRGQASKHGVPIPVSDTIAIALASNENELEERTVVRIIAAVMKDLAKELPKEEAKRTYGATPSEIIKACKRAGLLDKATSQTPHVRQDMLYSPVPSLLRDMVASHATNDSEIKRWLKRCKIDSEPAKRYTKRDTGRVRDTRKP